MYHYDPGAALEDLNGDVPPPNPVHERDMLPRAEPNRERASETHRGFAANQQPFGEMLQSLAGVN